MPAKRTWAERQERVYEAVLAAGPRGVPSAELKAQLQDEYLSQMLTRLTDAKRVKRVGGGARRGGCFVATVLP